MSCPRRRQCGGGSSWSYSWSSCGGVTTYNTTGNVPAQYASQGGSTPSVENDTIDSGKADLSKDYYEYGLYLHNWYRKHHGSPKMVLVDRLNKAGDAYAYKLACQRQLVHTSGLDYNENLYMSTDTSQSKKEHVRAACKAWYDEKKLYNFANGGFSMQTGHFTAMVWKGTTQLGIGCWEANGCVVVVACYKPHANMQGQFHTNVLPWRDVEDTDDEEEQEKKTDTVTVEKGKSTAADSDEAVVPVEQIPDEAKQAFESKADAKSTIGWSELKDLLNENVNVGFQFDGFDKVMCSLLISMMTIRNGEKRRINLDEFAEILKSVEGFLDAYTEFDKDCSGTLDPFELKAALEESGFNISYRTYLTLQKLFADGEPCMRFRGFVLCFVLLAKLQIVQEKRKGMLEDFSMKEWMEGEISAISPE